MFQEFQHLLDAHDEFHESVVQHQVALVCGDVPRARKILEALHTDLGEHIRFEEETLLPVVEEGGGWSRIGEPSYYREEHGRIRAFLDEFVAEMDLYDAADPDYARRVALLIGRQRSLITLLEHHDDRERRALYPDLLRLTTSEQRRKLLDADG